MSKPAQEKQRVPQLPAASQTGDPLSFKLQGSILLLILGAMSGLAAFAQVLTNLLFAPWFFLLTSLIGLALSLAVIAAGALMLLRRRYAEQLTPMLALTTTAALIAFKLAGIFLPNSGVPELILTLAVAAPIFVIVWRGAARTGGLRRPKDS